METELATPDQLEQEKQLARLLEGLPPPQSIAMQIILNGGTITAAATAADVSRRTLHRWLQPGQPLAAAVESWKSDLSSCARTRLVMLADLATTNVAKSLKQGDVKTALKILEKLGILASPAVGPTHNEIRRDVAQPSRHLPVKWLK